MPDRVETTDVAIAGCGPGGAVLGYLLARSGVDVALIERAATFEREYRGFGWNPGVIRLFDEMGVLDDVLDLAHETVTDGTFSLYGTDVSVLDFDVLDTEYPYALMMEQPSLLEYLVDRADAYTTFTFHPSTTVTDLRVEGNGTIQGIEAHDRKADADVRFDTRVVVGADGRYSTVRSSTGIDPGFFESPIDLVWFKLPSGAIDARTEGRIDRNGILLYFGLGDGELQVGYPILDGEWTSIRAGGFSAFSNRIAAIDSELASAMYRHLDGFRDTTLLDIAPGTAETWSRDGMALVGDAAHTASPIGAQGNPLAIEDAVVIHDVLATALRDSTGVVPEETLAEFETRRRPTVERVISLQRRGAQNLAFWITYGQYVPELLVRGSASIFSWLVPQLPPIRKSIESFALGDRSISVTQSHFIE
ncbi:FAD-dependent monooxygenase [Halalkalicoccus subterraneus]|uniref:FAD-dependent monooxygenase n=1 Tax=Halalkalicoccus subterraneus TaxID=2675002 RepID=UPI000EFCC68D|nr:FAD-dependent monooxygenase [Halalkalicoccus subterraneus]